MKQPKKMVHDNVKGNRKCLGKERVMVRNEVVWTIGTSALMVVAFLVKGISVSKCK